MKRGDTSGSPEGDEISSPQSHRLRDRGQRLPRGEEHIGEGGILTQLPVDPALDAHLTPVREGGETLRLGTAALRPGGNSSFIEESHSSEPKCYLKVDRVRPRFPHLLLRTAG